MNTGSFSGTLMERMVSFSRETVGYFTEEDLRNYRPAWVEPIFTDYRGYTVCELPPNGHGITVLMALNLLKGLELPAERESPAYYHLVMEAVKLAFADTKAYVADPRYMRTKVEDLLSEEYALRRRALISGRALYPEAGDPSCGGTVCLCTADPEGQLLPGPGRRQLSGEGRKRPVARPFRFKKGCVSACAVAVVPL